MIPRVQIMDLRARFRSERSVIREKIPKKVLRNWNFLKFVVVNTKQWTKDYILRSSLWQAMESLSGCRVSLLTSSSEGSLIGPLVLYIFVCNAFGKSCRRFLFNAIAMIDSYVANAFLDLPGTGFQDDVVIARPAIWLYVIARRHGVMTWQSE